jgi:hypothetical protein
LALALPGLRHSIMSSGPFTYSLSAAAAFVMRSLMEHPQAQTAEAIAAAPHAQGEIDADGARAALQELRQRGLASEDANRRWHLTESGRDGYTNRRGAISGRSQHGR